MSRFERSGTRSSAAIGASATARAYRRGGSLETTRDGLRRACARCARARGGSAGDSPATLARSGARPRIDRGGGPGGRRARAGGAFGPGVDRGRSSPRLRHGQPDRAARRLVPRAGHGRRRGRGRAEYFGSWVARVQSERGRLLGWAVRTDGLDAVARRLELPIHAGSRTTRSGDVLRWRLAGLERAAAEPSLPFFIEWARGTPFPGRVPVRHPAGAVRIAELRLAGDSDHIGDWLAARPSSDHRPHGAAGDREHRPRGTGGRHRPRHRSAVNELELRAMGEQLQLS